MPPEQPALLLDVQDLLSYLHDYGSVSGIQRVQLGIVAAVLRGQAGPLGAQCQMVFARPDDASLHQLRGIDMLAIIDHCTTTQDHAAARELVARARDAATPCEPRAGDALLILGAFWLHAGAPRFLAGLKARGLRLGVLIYDLFPATHPEFATEDTVRYFNQALNEGLLFWDFALAISEYSAAEFRRIAAARGFPAIPVTAVPLAHSFGMGLPETPAWLDTFPQSMQDIRGRDFVLCVCTVEVRKNHLLLFHAWQRMIEAGENPPVLVFAGRIGWGVRDLMAMLDNTRCLDGRIMLARDLSDVELAAMYRECLFTVFPSHGEGWGLAVGESLSFGKACLASGTTAVPEVGGDLVAYADPGSVPEWVAALRHWLRDRDALRAAEARIAQQFIPRGWPDVARAAMEAALRLAATPRQVPLAPAPLRLPPGRQVALGASFAVQGGLREARAAIDQAESFADGWHVVETACTWMRETTATLLLRTEAPEGSVVSATLDLRASPRDADNPLSLRMADGPPLLCEPAPGAFFTVTCFGHAGPDGLVSIRFQVARPGRGDAGDPRELTYGLLGVRLDRHDALPPPPPPTLPPAAALPPQPDPPAPPGGLRGLVQRLWQPLRHARLRGDALRAEGQWLAAARQYQRFLRARPGDDGMRLRLAECLARGGDMPGARAALVGMTGGGLPRPDEAAALLAARAARRPVLFLDVSALLLTGGSWAARRWAQHLARALLARPDCFALAAAPQRPFPHLLPGWLATALLEAPWHDRAARLLPALGSLPPLLPEAGETAILLAPPADDSAWRHAQAGGARLRLALAQAETPHAAHRAPHTGLAPPITGLPLPAADAGPGRDAPAPAPGAIICDEATPWLLDAMALLAQQGLPLPPLLTPPEEETRLAPMLQHARLAISTAPAGTWPAMRLAALDAAIPCLAAPDPLLGAAAPVLLPEDVHGTAATLRALLTEPAMATALAMAQRIDAAGHTPCDWDALAAVVAGDAPPAPQGAPAGMATAWALNAGAGLP